MDDISDERLTQLIELLRLREPGSFCNYAVFTHEITAMATELLRYREKPLHCPGCDGNHL